MLGVGIHMVTTSPPLFCGFPTKLCISKRIYKFQYSGEWETTASTAQRDSKFNDLVFQSSATTNLINPTKTKPIQHEGSPHLKLKVLFRLFESSKYSLIGINVCASLGWSV